MTGDGALLLRQADLGHGRRAVLTRLDAALRPGERVLLLGDNGSGKTTLLSTLAGLVPARAGSVRVLGLDPLKDRRRLHARIGVLGHAHPFYPELTGRENLALHARLRGLDRLVDAALADVELSAAADRPVGTYSHGMKRRLAVAKALLGAPEVLLLDEPESGLDAMGRAKVQALLTARRDVTVVLSTHHWEAYVGWADRAWILGDGGIAVDLVAGADGLTHDAIRGAVHQAGAHA